MKQWKLVLVAVVVGAIIGLLKREKQGVDALEFLLPVNGGSIRLVHQQVPGHPAITETLTYQFDQATNQINRVHKYSGASGMRDVIEVYQISNDVITKIGHMATVTKVDLNEKLADRKVAVGDKIENGQYEVTALNSVYTAASGEKIEPCIVAKGGKYQTEVWYCKGFGLVKHWSSGLPSTMSKGFAL